MKTVYLDNNATTAVAPEVREAILPYLGNLYGNPSSMHSFGGQVGQAVETARVQFSTMKRLEDMDFERVETGEALTIAYKRLK